MDRITAIDVLYSLQSTDSSADTLTLVGCAEKPQDLLRRMDAAGVSRVLLSPCKRWGCERHYLCGEVQADEISQYIEADNQRFAGFAWYNPYAITESLLQVKRAIQVLDLRGVYVHTEGSNLSICDRRLYPLYSHCVEMGVPVVLELGSTPALAHSSEVEEVILDFPELDVVAAWAGRLDFERIASLARKSEHLYFAFPASEPEQDCQIAELLKSPIGQRCMWGSSGLPWEELLDRIHLFPLPQGTLRAFVHDTAERLFGLSRPAVRLLKREESVPLAE